MTSLSTIAAGLAILAGTAVVAYFTFKAGRPVASLRQELYGIEHPSAEQKSGTPTAPR